jgi:hypothetical protein
MVLAVGALLLMGAACSDDDDEGGGVFGGGGNGGGEVPGQSSDQGGFGGDQGGDVGGDQGAGGGGFTDASQGTFESNCANFPGATPGLCECAWGQITSTVSESEYAAFEQEFLSDPSTPLPSWLTDAVAGCSDDN